MPLPQFLCLVPRLTHPTYIPRLAQYIHRPCGRVQPQLCYNIRLDIILANRPPVSRGVAHRKPVAGGVP